MRTIVFFAAATLGLLVTLPVSAATEPSELGWWWAGYATETLLVFQPVPPVPDGGLYVAGDASGPSGISALRFELREGDRAQLLEIVVSESVGSPVVDACAAREPWEAVDGGAWERRAQADCEAGRAAGVLSEDGATVTFEVGPLARAGTLDLVLVPGADPMIGAPATFAASFERPEADILEMRQSPDPDDAPTTQEQPGAPVPAASAPAASAPTASAPIAPSRVAPIPSVATPDAPLPQPTDQEKPLVAHGPSVPANAGATLQALDTGFAYPAILALPLLMLAMGSYLAWALTRPVTIGATR